VIHLAARVHVMRDLDPDPEAAFDRVNGLGTRRLAEAMVPGTPLILVSSIKVNGERTSRDQGFAGDQPPAPEDPYGRSKLKAEQAALAVLGTSAIILRPPLVYGPGVGGNLATLLRAVRRGVPLPLGAIDNRRSLIARTNLVSAIVTALDHPHLGGNPFTLSDGSEFSTPELIRALARALGRSPRLLPVPVGVLRGAARLLGRGAALERLTGSLLVDGGAFRRATGWQPVISPEAALAEMAMFHA
jgi:nucleoside-diphosphate-sugar epimerase